MSALLLEVIGVLREYEALRCTVEVETSDDRDGNGVVRLTIEVPTVGQVDIAGAMLAIEFYRDAKYLADVTQMRELAARYQIDAAKLEALLPPQKEKEA